MPRRADREARIPARLVEVCSLSFLRKPMSWDEHTTVHTPGFALGRLDIP